MRSFLASLASLSFLCAGCASTPAPQSTDAVAQRQELAADANEEHAKLHASQYDPNAKATTGRCSRGRSGDAGDGGICWSSEVNPTATHLEKARRYQALAEKQRAQSEKLRNVEGQACVGVSEMDRDASPFSHPEDVAAVAPLKSTGSPARLEGALIAFQSVEGMTAPRLERLVTCHLARNACLDDGAKDVAYCPLALKNVKASVTQTADGLFAVAVRSDDPAVAEEVLRRAQALTVH
jgi:hypothetical protein